MLKGKLLIQYTVVADVVVPSVSQFVLILWIETMEWWNSTVKVLSHFRVISTLISSSLTPFRHQLACRTVADSTI